MGHYDCKSCYASPWQEHSVDCERFGPRSLGRHEMTDKDKALVEKLRHTGYLNSDNGDWGLRNLDGPEAADRIEEMAARYEKSQDQIDRLIAENERIRERLGWICAVMDLDDDVSLQWIYAELEALRGLGDTK